MLVTLVEDRHSGGFRLGFGQGFQEDFFERASQGLQGADLLAGIGGGLPEQVEAGPFGELDDEGVVLGAWGVQPAASRWRAKAVAVALDA